MADFILNGYLQIDRGYLNNDILSTDELEAERLKFKSENLAHEISVSKKNAYREG